MNRILMVIMMAGSILLTSCSVTLSTVPPSPEPAAPTAMFIAAEISPTIVTAASDTPTSALLPTDNPTSTPPPTPIPSMAPTYTPVRPTESCPQFSFENALPQNSDVAESYVGHHYDDLNLPVGLQFQGAAVLDDVYSYVHVLRPNHQMYWLEKFLCRDNGGRSYYEIISAINAPLGHDTYTHSDGDCVDSRGNDANVFVAFGEYDSNETPKPVDKRTMFDLDYVIRLDLATGSLSTIPPTELTCFHLMGPGGTP